MQIRELYARVVNLAYFVSSMNEQSTQKKEEIEEERKEEKKKKQT